MSKYNFKGNDKIKLCEGTKCIHRFRCYRHSLYQDAIFKSQSFESINIEECLHPTDEMEENNIYSFNQMWLPEKSPKE